MTELQLRKFENENPTLLVMDSIEKGLHYIFDDDRSRFAISGKGKTYRDNGCVISTDRARELLAEGIPYFDERYLIFGQRGNIARLTEKQATALIHELPGIIKTWLRR